MLLSSSSASFFDVDFCIIFFCFRERQLNIHALLRTPNVHKHESTGYITIAANVFRIILLLFVLRLVIWTIFEVKPHHDLHAFIVCVLFFLVYLVRVSFVYSYLIVIHHRFLTLIFLLTNLSGNDNGVVFG